MNGVSLDRRALKQDAKAAMRQQRPSIYLITLVFLLIMAVLEALGTRLQLNGVSVAELTKLDPNNAQQVMSLMLRIGRPGAFVRILILAVQLMSGILDGGYSLTCLNVSRREAAGFGTLFDMFGYFFRYIWLMIVMGVFTFLWSLLLVIPGIVAAYRYSMAPFIFFDDPEKGALDCIRESKEMTRGYKGKLFVLDLSFIGWALLSVIPLVSLYTMPYMSVTKANYYRALSGRFLSPEQQYQQQQQQYYGGPWNGQQ